MEKVKLPLLLQNITLLLRLPHPPLPFPFYLFCFGLY